MAENPQKFYLTTPIYYVNARPHIGHAYTTIVADVLARRHRLLGPPTAPGELPATFFLTGTDEHGQKIERSAAAAGIPPQQFADQVSASFEALWRRMGITNDDYIRTTSPRHAAGVQKLWRELESRGHIYLSSYTGAYCVSDEAFVDLPVGTPCPDCGRPLEQITEENYFFRLSAFQEDLIKLIGYEELLISPRTRRNEVLSFLCGNINSVLGEYTDGNPPIPVSDELGEDGIAPAGDSGLIGALKLAVAAGKLKTINNEVYYVPGALKDLSISRTGFKWGIPVPGNEKHVVYVWLDALANYMTAVGYGSDKPEDIKKFKKYWPADLHLVGKEIIRFHCVYWPAFLLGLNSRWQQGPSNDPQDGKLVVDADAAKMLPKKVQAHGWLLFEESKMSKSRGNIVRTETILEAFGDHYRKELVRLGQPKPAKADADLFAADVLRYFLLREIPFGNDGSFSFDALITRYNADLANGYGNLVSRTFKLIEQNLDGVMIGSKTPWLCELVTEPSNENHTGTAATVHIVGIAEETIRHSFETCRLDSVTSSLALRVGVVDNYLSVYKPWILAKQTDPESRQKLVEVLYTAAESIRIITALLYPILPYTTAKVWAQLGLGDIEAAAKNGDMKNLQWGGLKPGTKLGPLAPIFPRAPKELAQIMTDMENPIPAKTEQPEPLTTPGTPTEPGAPSSPAASSPAKVGSQDAPAAEAPKPEASPTITIDDFIKIDLRAARILVAERIPKADKLLRLEVDLGPLGTRQILSGIAEHYTPEELIGRRIVVIANLAPRKMRSLESHGMLLAASEGPENGETSGKPILATFAEDIAPGSRLK